MTRTTFNALKISDDRIFLFGWNSNTWTSSADYLCYGFSSSDLSTVFTTSSPIISVDKADQTFRVSNSAWSSFYIPNDAMKGWAFESSYIYHGGMHQKPTISTSPDCISTDATNYAVFANVSYNWTLYLQKYLDPSGNNTQTSYASFIYAAPSCSLTQDTTVKS